MSVMPVSEECVQSEKRDKEKTVETSSYTGEDGMHRGALTELESATKTVLSKPRETRRGVSTTLNATEGFNYMG